MYEYPIIKIELQRMQQTIQHALIEYNKDIENYVEKSLKDAIENFDYSAIVKSCADEAIKKTVEGYFKWGKGHEFIQAAVNLAMMELFKMGEEK